MLYFRFLQHKSFPVDMISVMCRNMTNDELIQKATQLLTMIMHNKTILEEAVVEDFIQKRVNETFRHQFVV